MADARLNNKRSRTNADTHPRNYRGIQTQRREGETIPPGVMAVDMYIERAQAYFADMKDAIRQREHEWDHDFEFISHKLEEEIWFGIRDDFEHIETGIRVPITLTAETIFREYSSLLNGDGLDWIERVYKAALACLNSRYILDYNADGTIFAMIPE